MQNPKSAPSGAHERTKYFADSESFPRDLLIETTSRCNAGCRICPHSRMQRRPGNMRDDLFRSVIDQASEHASHLRKVHLFMHGEPLMDSTLPERVAYAKSRKIPHVFIATNGQLLTTDLGKRLREAGLDELLVSLDGVDARTHEAIRPGVRFATVERNIEDFAAAGGPTRLVVRMIVMKENADQVDAFRKRWDRTGINVDFHPAHNWGGKIDGLDAASAGRLRSPCMALWEHMVVLHDGTVPLCCLDNEAKHKLGDANATPLGQIWMSGLYRRARNAHLAHRFYRYGLCRDCSYTYSIPKPPWWFVPKPSKRSLVDSIRQISPKTSKQQECVDGRKNPVFGLGFYPDEGGWRWMGRSAQLLVPFEVLQRRSILFLSFSPGQREVYQRFPFTLRVWTGGRRRADITIAEPVSPVALELPASGTDILVQLESEEAFCPALQGLNEDMRELAVRVAEAKILQLV